MNLMFETDTQFEFELVRTMGQTAYGCAELGECLATVRHVTERDYDSWYDAWHSTAERVRKAGETALSRGHLVSARDAYLRASNYFRTAEFFLHGNPADPRIVESAECSVGSFQSAARLCTPAVDQVEIPYEDTTLPGYFYRGSGSEPGPVVIIHNGFDGSGEEIYAFGGLAGQERGYNVLAFEGPGQGQVIRKQGLTFRPDWENVIGPVLDFVSARPEVDPTRIALVGISMGGCLAPRAAAFERRLAAVVAFDGVYDMATVPLDFTLQVPAHERDQMRRRLAAPHDAELDEMIEGRIAENATVRWFTQHGMWVMGCATPRELYARWCDFTVSSGVAEQIECPVLVMKAENDMTLAGQAEALYEHVLAQKRFIEFTTAEGGDLHNQVDVLRYACAQIYDWLDEVLPERSGKASP